MQKKQTKAVVYARFSPRRHAAECESLETQRKYCETYCSFNDLEVIGFHADEALSGKRVDNRPGLEDAIGQAIKHKAMLVVYSLCRLSRSTLHSLEICERLHQGGADFCSITQKFDTSSAMGKMIFTVLAAVQELMRRQISDTTKAAMLQHQASGRRMSSTCPYGWQDDPDDPARMIHHPGEIAAIREIVEMRKQGQTLNGIAKQMQFRCRPGGRKLRIVDGKRVTTRCKWSHHLVSRILKRHDEFPIVFVDEG